MSQVGLIDGNMLVRKIEEELIDKVRFQSYKIELPGRLKSILGVRQNLLEAIWLAMISTRTEIGEKIEVMLNEMAPQLNREICLEVGKHLGELPDDFRDIYNVWKKVKKQVDALLEPNINGNTDGSVPPQAPLKGVDDGSFVKFEKIDGKLAVILADLASELKAKGWIPSSQHYRIAGNNLKQMARFEPFIRLGKETELSPETWMDSPAVRKYCARWYAEQIGDTTLSAASGFYAWVTPKFRDKPNSLWQQYLASKEELPSL